MIRVQFDHQIFRLQESGGISRYFVELARAFIENPEIGIEPVFNFKYTLNKHLFEAFPDMGFHLVDGHLGKFLLKILAFFPNRIAARVDCLHYTFYLPMMKITRSDLPTISTLHDMIPELLGAEPGLKNPHFYKVRYLSESSAVISVSQSSALEYQKLVRPARQDLHVIPHGTGLMKKSVLDNEVSDGSFLFVGKRSGYKDGMLAVKALGRLKNPNVRLIFAGGGPFNHEERELIHKLGLIAQVSQVTPSDSELIELYERASALISPSRYEGFGLPVLEASLFKCPLVLSKIPPYEEILGPAAYYFDVGSEDQLAQQILNVLKNPIQAKETANLCQSIAKNYTWHRCALLTAKVYKDLVG